MSSLQLSARAGRGLPPPICEMVRKKREVLDLPCAPPTSYFRQLCALISQQPCNMGMLMHGEAKDQRG